MKLLTILAALALASCGDPVGVIAPAAAAAAGKPLALSLAPSAVTVTEGQAATFTLNKSGGNGHVTAAKVTASDGSFSASVMPGSSFTVPTKDDAIVNGTRSVTITAIASTGASAKASLTVLDNDVAPPPVVTPPPPTTAGDFPGDPTIADNWDTASKLGTGFTATKEDMSAGNGAWRIIATAGQLLYDDSIFYPGQPGMSHLHQHFCNTGANAYSTYQSLRTTGGTTCGRADAPFIRSAAWFPAMLDGVGNVVKPDYIKLYYKRNSVYDPMCQDNVPPHLGKCTPLPNDLTLVWGAHPGTGDTFLPGTIWFSCAASDDGTVGVGAAGTGKYQSISEVAAAGCPVGAQLVIAANSPSCWDGAHLDSADHRSHMAYATGVWTAPQLFPACPADHPYPIPNVELLIQFTVDANLATWHVSSDEMDPAWPNIPHGKTMHADYREGWSPIAKAKMEACLNGPYSASSGAFCDGTGIPGGDVPWDCCNGTPGWQKHVLVPVPLNPITGTTKPPM